ncbi:hypothetical protein Ddc_17379 [Ditylenchus destructor]|nr:hypothetical protein Ddc_17379 [Ditylenchus destructor]
MAKKVFLTNEIFKMYLFAMASISAPQTVMAVLVMTRRKTWLGVYYSAVETTVSLIHLAQLTIIPAQVHSEFRIPQFLLYRNTSLWEKYSHDTYEIVRTFIRNISMSHFGISLGDFMVVTQSMMFKCISVMVPYIAVCIQMKFGDDLTLRYNISADAG